MSKFKDANNAMIKKLHDGNYGQAIPDINRKGNKYGMLNSVKQARIGYLLDKKGTFVRRNENGKPMGTTKFNPIKERTLQWSWDNGIITNDDAVANLMELEDRKRLRKERSYAPR